MLDNLGLQKLEDNLEQIRVILEQIEKIPLNNYLDNAERSYLDFILKKTEKLMRQEIPVRKTER